MSKTLSVVFAVWVSAASLSVAATIPAGTLLRARTAQPVSSHESIGATFKAELVQPVAIDGKVLLPAGTQLTGVVETSLKNRHSSKALTVNLKAISIHGRSVPVQTTGAFRLDRATTSRGVSVSGREWNFPYHTRIAFHLAQPVNL
jgi:hypothetical protein